MAKYESKNSGLLKVDDVKDGDKVILVEGAYEQFSETQQKSYWNAKVALPNGTEKLAGLMDSTMDAFAAKWGSETDEWKGKTAIVAIKDSKKGTKYITLTPSDDATVPTAQKVEDDGLDSINPSDIPF